MTTTATPRPTLPPGPPSPWWGLPLLRAMSRDYLGFAQHLHDTYGDIVTTRIGPEQGYDVFAPELIRSVLVDHAEHFIRWERGTQVFAQAMGQSVLVTEGAVWQRQRRLLTPGFAPRRMAAYTTLMVAAAERALDGLPAAPHFTLDFGHTMTQLTMDVIARALFSSESAQESLDAEAAVRTLGQVAMREMFRPFTLPDWLPLPGKARKRWALRRLDEIVWGHIRQRQRQQPHDGNPNDLLAMLLAARDEQDDRLTDTEVRDQCMTIFQAGHETSATALTWWGWAMAAHPHHAARAAAEVDSVLGQRRPTLADLAALPWLEQTLKEAMRRFPPIPALMTRRALRDVPIGPWTVPKGAMVRLTPWVLHHDPRWFPDPQCFDPARFAPDAPELPRGVYLPFGTGPRVCIGQHFAMAEMLLVAAMFLQRYRFEALADTTPPQAELQVTLRPKTPLQLRVHHR